MKKIEKLFVAVILLLSLLSMGIMTLTKSSQNGNILIKVDNKLVKKVPINNSGKSKTYDFNFNGNTAYVESKDGKVRMLEMSKELCPNGICSKTGWIDQTYQSIVCLPNKIVVTIEGQQEGEIDVIP